MLKTQTVQTPAGERIKLHSNIDELSCSLLAHFVKRAHASRIIEVGFAYGASALAIASAAATCARIEHHIFDPYQQRAWQGIGIENMRRAGFGDRFTFHDELSEFGLPKLVEAGYQCDFAFIDGNHTFDHVLLDFFYINRMLAVGGIVVFDDEWIPAIRKVTHYVEKYPAYQRLDMPPHLTIAGKTIVVGNHRRLAAFQKTAQDERNWDWYEEF